VQIGDLSLGHGGWGWPERIACLDARQGGCAGEIKYRESLSGTGQPIQRCDVHWSLRLDKQAGIVRRYDPFGSGGPPESFDPSYAGEEW
jgi:hypothetical protein